MSLTINQDRRYTISDLESFPEDRRAELIDGIVYDLACPSRIHQKMVHFLDRVIGNHIEEKNLPCDVYPAPFAVYPVPEDEYTYLEPDISVICDQSKLTDRGCNGAPDWVIEVVSPSTASRDYVYKAYKYQKSGVRLYWIVDPEAGTVMIYDYENSSFGSYRFDDELKVSICEDFMIRFSDFDKKKE